MAILSTLESTTHDENIRCASKWFILAQRMHNLEFVSLKCVAYTQPIPLPLTKVSNWYKCTKNNMNTKNISAKRNHLCSGNKTDFDNFWSVSWYTLFYIFQ